MWQNFKDWFGFTDQLNTQNIANLLQLVNPIVAVGANGVSRLKKTAKEWYQSFLQLQQIPDSELSPELLSDKKSLMSRGQSIVNKIRSLGLGADTLQSSLGALPFIAVGVIATAASLMLYWTYDFVKFKDKLAVYRAARASGESVASANSVMQSLESSSSFFGLSNILKYGAIIGVGYATYSLAKSKKWV